MPDTSLSASEFKMLYGLMFAGRAYISASEHNMALSLCERGLAKAATYADGMHAWMITDAGKSAVERASGTTLTER